MMFTYWTGDYKIFLRWWLFVRGVNICLRHMEAPFVRLTSCGKTGYVALRLECDIATYSVSAYLQLDHCCCVEESPFVRSSFVSSWSNGSTRVQLHIWGICWPCVGVSAGFGRCPTEMRVMECTLPIAPVEALTEVASFQTEFLEGATYGSMYCWPSAT